MKGFKKGHTVNNGRVLTEEHKEKIRAGMERAKAEGKAIGHPKGMTTWNKGVSIDTSHLHTKEVWKKISVANTGKKHSEETKKKLSDMYTGKHVSPRTEFKKGGVSLRKGVTLSEETKRKISKGRTGQHLSPEAIRRAWTRRTPTSLEMKFQSIVEKHGLPYKFVGDGSFMLGRKNPDFININGAKIAVEVYARYYKLRHVETIDQWKEERRRVFGQYGWKIVFFDETQVNERAVVKNLKEEESQWLRSVDDWLKKPRPCLLNLVR